MGKKKTKQGHFCRICHRYRANEKFSGKGHRQHICKDCNRELQQRRRERKRANKVEREVGLRPLKGDYPKTAKQAASYLQIKQETFGAYCLELDVKGLQVDDEWAEPFIVYDMDAMIQIHLAVEAQHKKQQNTEEELDVDA